HDTSPSLSYPPGFTPASIEPKTGNVHINEVVNDIPVNVTSPLLDAEVMNLPQVVQMEVPSGSIAQSVDSNGGSVLGVLEEVIRVGQAMGYSMEGCEKDIEAIIGNQGDDCNTPKIRSQRKGNNGMLRQSTKIKI
ncbi:hypothetical protein Tco_1566497, partial [Tanacetum coccineum]